MTEAKNDKRRTSGWVSRRSLFAATGTIAVAASPVLARADLPDERPSGKRDVFLRETDHIRTYYALARR